MPRLLSREREREKTFWLNKALPLCYTPFSEVSHAGATSTLHATKGKDNAASAPLLARLHGLGAL